MPRLFQKRSGTWVEIKSILQKQGGTWTEILNVFQKISGTWTLVFSGVKVPGNTTAPTITGTGYLYGTLTNNSVGTWTNNPTTYTRQWRRANPPAAGGEPQGYSNISGATSSTYVTTIDDNGKYIVCQVTATNAAGSNSASSSPIYVNKYAPVSLSGSGGYSLSSASNSPSVGQTLSIVKGTDPDWKETTTNTGDTSPDSFAYEWKWADTEQLITGATSSTYLVAESDLTHTIAVRVKGINTGGELWSAWSTPSAAVTQPVVVATMPSITTTDTEVGKPLTGNTGTYTPTPDKVYWMWQWYNTTTASWTPIYNSSGNILGNPTSVTDTSENQDHSATIPAFFYNSSGTGGVNAVGKLIRFVASASKGTTFSPTYESTSLGPITAVVESITNRVPTASSNIYRRVDGFWTAFATATTNVTIDWVNTRIRNTGTGGTSKNTFFTTTGADLTTDFFTDIGGTGLTQTSYRFGVQAVGTGDFTGTSKYSIGTSDEGAYSENTSNINPQFPSRPTGFTATRFSNSRIDLAWNAAAGSPTAYELYFAYSDSSSSIDKTTTADFVLGNVTSSQRTGLAAQTEYWWWVRSKNATGVSNWSVGRSATTDANPTTTTTTTTTAAPTTTTTTTAAPTTTTTAAPTPVFTTSTPTRSRSARTLSMAWTYTKTNVAFSWWNTRLRNTSTNAAVIHTLYSETPTTDSYTSVVTGTFVLGVQGRGVRGTNSTVIYTVGTSDEGSFTESSSISVPSTA